MIPTYIAAGTTKFVASDKGNFNHFVIHATTYQVTHLVPTTEVTTQKKHSIHFYSVECSLERCEYQFMIHPFLEKGVYL